MRLIPECSYLQIKHILCPIGVEYSEWPLANTLNGSPLLLPNDYLTAFIGSLDISDTISCFRLDGFPQPTWTKKECSKEPMFADLAPFKSGTIFYLLCLEKMTHSLQENNIRHTKKFFCCFVFSGYSFFSECFYPVSLSSIMHQLCFRLCCVWILEDVLFNFCTGAKEKTGLLSVSVCVLCRGFIELRTQQRLTVDSFTLKKKAPFCCSSMRGEIIVQYR